ncbi:MAG: anaerobic sulfatase maturase [Candidatus Binatia bacterium]
MHHAGELEGLGPATPLPFHVVLKPRGPLCNLGCTYCFYLRTEALFDAGATFRMSDEVLEAFTRQYLAAHPGPEITFAWQGGEPTLMGLDFFRRAVALQARHRRSGTHVANALQTNGLLLDDAWCRFLKAHGFLVGLSLDGPRALHDAHRVDKGNQPTFDRVLAALALLRHHDVAHNVLCVVTETNGAAPRAVYDFFRSQGVRWLQFIPAVEHAAAGGVTAATVRPATWGRFLCTVFDAWVRHDVGHVFVQQFDGAVEAAVGLEPSLCVHARTCGRCLAMEHDGSLYACDHYVRPAHRLGRVVDTALAELVDADAQRRFGTDKWDGLPRACRECPVLAACHGGCPKDRFAAAPTGEPGLNWLCAGYREFFTHAAPCAAVLGALVRAGRPPALVMDMLRGAVPRGGPCPCGSGVKHKRCCGARLGGEARPMGVR